MTREAWIDAWRGLLIVFVVLGHVVGGGCHLAVDNTREALRILYAIIYAFHMPAFFFLIGWIWKEQPSGPFVMRRFSRLMLPYFSVGILSILMYSCVGGNQSIAGDFSSDYYNVSVGNNGAIFANLLSLVHGGGWPDGQGFRYNSVLWFLPCMFLTQIVYVVVRQRVRSLAALWGVAGVSFSLMVVLDVLNIVYWPWGVSKVPYYLIFVVAGEIARRLCKASRIPVMRFAVSLLLAVGFGIWVWLYAYRELRTGYFAYPLRVITPLWGIYLSMLLAQSIKGRVQAILCAAGACSMTIMLWHKFFVVAAQIKIPFVSAAYRSGLVGAAFMSLAITIGATTSCWLMAKVWGKGLEDLRGLKG